MHIVQPDTLLRWHRELFRVYWRRKSQGQPKISAETIVLIRKMAKENPLWGAERIRGELLKLGMEVSKRTIQKYLPKERGSSSSSQTWATFIKNQAIGIWACDFTVVYDWLFRQSYVYVVMERQTRRIACTVPQTQVRMRGLRDFQRMNGRHSSYGKPQGGEGDRSI
ncbi:MAG: helix-turn-helix domain-containing protein [Anaerolineales bacterium]